MCCCGLALADEGGKTSNFAENEILCQESVVVGGIDVEPAVVGFVDSNVAADAAVEMNVGKKCAEIARVVAHWCWVDIDVAIGQEAQMEDQASLWS